MVGADGKPLCRQLFPDAASPASDAANPAEPDVVEKWTLSDFISAI